MGQGADITGTMGRMARALEAEAPAFLLRAGLPPRRIRSVQIAALPLDEPARAALLLAGRGGTAVDIRLGPGVFLRRSLPLPGVARRDLAGAVAIQMRQSMPGQAAGLIWRHVPTPEGAEVYVLKETRLTAFLREAGVAVRRVVIDGVETAPLIDARRESDAPERFWNRAAPLTVLAVLLAVAGAQGWRLHEVRSALARDTVRLATLRDEAAAARAEAETRSAIGSARLADLARLARDNRRLPMLADLTRVLGDGVWISNLALDGDVLRLSGFAEAGVAEVMAAIRPLPWVEAVDLEGAVALDDAQGTRRFLLNVQLAAGGAE